MNAPRLALAALLSALGAGSAFAQPMAPSLMPIVNGPAGPGQCVIGMDFCGGGPGFSMDPATEGALIGLGEPATPASPIGGAALKAPSRASAAPPAPDETEAVARLGVGIGGIINPPGGLVAARSAPPRAPAGPATLGAAFSGGGDASLDPMANPGQPGNPQAFSYRRMQKASAAALLLEKDVPAPDSKLAPGDSDLAPGATRAAANGR